ncbi:hypothetical protein [Tomitella cavernea]|uniref:hypothetical protein n=1 Tax=Tomitella cavernea TaxID=1387982 RepID=UPI0019087150|nr:hypothetical protein [Tomitella cavernea]
MSYSPDPSAFSNRFDVVRKGYDRDQVVEFLRRLDAELRLTATDRDAAAAQASDLAAQLDDARDEIDQLRSEIDRLSVPPTTAEGMSDRISRMLRLASDETAEMRARAEAEAAEIRSVAAQDADELQKRHEGRLRDLERRREALESEHEHTMELARTQAGRTLEAAEAERDRLDEEARVRRDRTYEDLQKHIEETKRVAAAEADRRIKAATQEAGRRITRARADFETLRTMRSHALEQLMEVRTSLDDVAAVHQRVRTERAPAESDFDWYEQNAAEPAGQEAAAQVSPVQDAPAKASTVQEPGGQNAPAPTRVDDRTAPGPGTSTGRKPRTPGDKDGDSGGDEPSTRTIATATSARR